MKRFLSLVILALLMCMAVALVINAETTQCTEHVFGKYEMTTPPTCERDGLITYICTVCGATETSTVEARHDYHSKVEKVADCYNEGSLVHTCLTCGDTKTETTSKTHTYRSEIIVAPTCDTAGETKYTCSTCGDTYTEATPATHTYSDIKVLYVPTCFYEGSIRFTCSVCGETLTESVAKTHSYESEVTIPATCETEGVLRHTCLYCNTTHTDVIPASHDYSGGVTRIEYTDYTQTGIKYIECKNGCGVNEGVIANPIFIFRGYSVAKEYVNEGDLVELTCGYKVDVEALKEYNTVMKDSPLEIGVVGAVVSHLAEGEPPLNSATAEPVTTTQQAGFVKKIKFNNQGYSNANANLINIDYDRHTTYFYFCMYV
ncbi:MAG: hypothetical protein J6B29_06405 [Clostridia bacterium]|nr:hypothetical protein [Clostridia bacterium]